MAHGLVAVVKRDAQAVAGLVVLALMSGQTVAYKHVARQKVAARPQRILGQRDSVAPRARRPCNA